MSFCYYSPCCPAAPFPAAPGRRTPWTAYFSYTPSQSVISPESLEQNVSVPEYWTCPWHTVIVIFRCTSVGISWELSYKCSWSRGNWPAKEWIIMAPSAYICSSFPTDPYSNHQRFSIAYSETGGKWLPVDFLKVLAKSTKGPQPISLWTRKILPPKKLRIAHA